MEFYTEPRGNAYERIIDVAIRNSECFVLGEKRGNLAELERDAYLHVLEALEPYRLKTVTVHQHSHDNMEEILQIQQTYRSNAFYSEGAYYFYSCCEESGKVLKQSANSLSDWIYPNLPEDLCFLKAGGGDYLYSIIHERMYGMGIPDEEAAELMEQITGVFFKLEAHKDIDRLLDDAIKHRTYRLSISGHGLTTLPKRIRELTELRELEIFEQDLFRLPEELFVLSKLERLTIMTAELEKIPVSITKLKNLRYLSIGCGCSFHPTPGWQVKPREQISLNHIPPEIGELEQLEYLILKYTSIQEIPPELQQLKGLRCLDLGGGLIRQRPDFINDMKELRYVML